MMLLEAKPRGTKDYQQANQKLGERHGTGSSSQPYEGTNPPSSLVLEFQPQEPQDNIFLLFKSPLSMWYFVYGSPSKLIQFLSCKSLRLAKVANQNFNLKRKKLLKLFTITSEIEKTKVKAVHENQFVLNDKKFLK